jgi:hypothetical protein
MKMFSLARFLRRRRTYRIVFEARASYSEYELPTSGLIVPIFAISPAAYRKNRPSPSYRVRPQPTQTEPDDLLASRIDWARLGRPEAPPEPDVRF